MNPCESIDDATLARRAQGGSCADFDALVHRYHSRVFGFLLTLTRHRQDAEDLTQETFLRAWDKIRRYNPEMPLLPWLFTLARRQSITALRRKRPPLPAEAMIPNHPEPETRTHLLWTLAEMHLTPLSYSALWLHYREELQLKDVARILEKREGAVKVLLHRARKSLADIVSGNPAAGDADLLQQPQRFMP